jgi:transcriptional regulator with XRE-family HTH domain
MLSPIKSNIAEKLHDRGYRTRFFRGRAEDEIAYSLRKFRKIRKLNQKELADLCEMKQSAISRIEQATYSKWNIQTLWRIAEALDIRIRVYIDTAEDAITEYAIMETQEDETKTWNFPTTLGIFATDTGLMGSIVNTEFSIPTKMYTSTGAQQSWPNQISSPVSR